MTEEKKPVKKKLRKDLSEEQKAVLAEGPVDRTPEQALFALRRAVHIFYDLQEMRLSVEGRTTKKAKGSEIQLHKYDVVTLTRRTMDLSNAEASALKDVQEHLDGMPFYAHVLSDKSIYKGIGPTLAGVLLSEFDVHRADTISKFWKYAGLAPIPCKRCKDCNRVADPAEAGTYKHAKGKIWKSKKAEDGTLTSENIICKFGEDAVLVADQVYDSGKSAKPVKGEKLNYNSWLRAKMLGVLATCLLKAKSPFTVHYYNRKSYLVSKGRGVNDNHRHKDAMRYMVKMFLADFWLRWRAFAELPIRPPYAEEKLGHKHEGGSGLTSASTPESHYDEDDAMVMEELKRAGIPLDDNHPSM